MRRKAVCPKGVVGIVIASGFALPVVRALVLLASGPAPAVAVEAVSAPVAPWEALEPGLELGVFRGPPADIGDRSIHVLRIDPERFSLALLNASATADGRTRTAREWVAHASASGKEAVAAINASMYDVDHRTSVALMRTVDHVNNGRLTKDNAVLAFDPVKPGVPAVRLLDRACGEYEAARASYGSLVQNIRMVSCDGTNTWAPQAKIWSTAAVGVDRQGRVLFIHARTPWRVHDLVNALLALPIDLRNAMYVEGGPEAQLYVKAGGRELERIGSFETGFHEADDVFEAWPVPNVLAVVRRPSSFESPR